MSLNTLAYAKALTAGGVDRGQAEAHAQAMVDYVMPQLATKADLEAAAHTLTLRVVATVAAFNGLLFALLKLTA